MGVLWRYIFSEILKILLLVWVGLSGIIFIFEWLGNAFRLKASVWEVFVYYLFKVPSHLQIVFPVAVLFSVLVVIGNMNRWRELVAANSVGVNVRFISQAAASAVGLASIFYIFFSFYFAPIGLKKHYEYLDVQIKNRSSRFSKIKKEKIWFKNKDVIYNVGFFNPQKKEIVDLSVFYFYDDFRFKKQIFAKKALWQKDRWILSDGRVLQNFVLGADPEIREFKRKEIVDLNPPKEMRQFNFDAEAMTQDELARTIERYQKLGVQPSKWVVAYHGRMTYVVIAFVFLLLAVARGVEFNRISNPMKDGGIVIILCGFYWIMYTYFYQLGAKGRINPIVAVWTPVLIFSTGCFFYLRQKRLKA